MKKFITIIFILCALALLLVKLFVPTTSLSVNHNVTTIGYFVVLDVIAMGVAFIMMNSNNKQSWL